jgi:hypothetical protein
MFRTTDELPNVPTTIPQPLGAIWVNSLKERARGRMVPGEVPDQAVGPLPEEDGAWACDAQGRGIFIPRT